jgi:hypothetical protein
LNDLSRSPSPLDPDGTLIAVIELSLSSWLVAGIGHTDDRDHLFRSIATSVARVLTAPLDDGGDVSLLMAGQARREAVPVVNRRDPRVTRSALTAGAAARAGGPC